MSRLYQKDFLTAIPQFSQEDQEMLTGLVKFYMYLNEYLVYSNGELVELKTTRDKAIVILRDKIKIAPPQGFAFVIEELSFETTAIQTAGTTKYYRYISLKKGLFDTDTKLRKKYMATVLSHELVHVYLNCSLGYGHIDDLPKWFQEGCAIYFAGQTGNEVIDEKEKGDTKVITYSGFTEEYKNYRRVFSFLRSSGEKKFYQFIRDSVRDRSVERSLPAIAGVGTFDELMVKTRHYETVETIRFWIAIVLTLLAIYTLSTWWMEIKNGRILSPKITGFMIVNLGIACFLIITSI